MESLLTRAPRPSPVAAAPDCASCSKIGFARGRLVLQQIGKPKISPALREFFTQIDFLHGFIRSRPTRPVHHHHPLAILEPRGPSALVPPLRCADNETDGDLKRA